MQHADAGAAIEPGRELLDLAVVQADRRGRLLLDEQLGERTAAAARGAEHLFDELSVEHGRSGYNARRSTPARAPATLGYSQASEGSTGAFQPHRRRRQRCLLLVACGGDDPESLGPPPEASPTGNVSPASPSPAVTGATGATGAPGATGTPLPTTSPGFTGSVNVGNASLAISGAMHISEAALPLTGPTIYAPPPGPFALGWDTDTAAFALSGTSFLGNHPTSATLRLTFSIRSGSGPHRSHPRTADAT